MSLSRITTAATESNVPQLKGRQDQSGKSQMGLFSKIFAKIHLQSKVIAKPDNNELPQSEKAIVENTKVAAQASDDKPKVKTDAVKVALSKDDRSSDETSRSKESASSTPAPADTKNVVVNPAVIAATTTTTNPAGNPAGVFTVDPGKVSEAAAATPGNPKVDNPSVIPTNLTSQTANPVIPQVGISIDRTPVMPTPEFGQIAAQGNGKPNSIQQNMASQVASETLVKSAQTPFQAVAPNQLGATQQGTPVGSADSKINSTVPQQPEAPRTQINFPESMKPSVKAETAPDVQSVKAASNPILAGKTVESNTPQPLQHNQSGKFSTTNLAQDTAVQNPKKVTDSRTTSHQVSAVSPAATTARQTEMPAPTQGKQPTPEPNHSSVASGLNQKPASETTPPTPPNFVRNNKPAPASAVSQSPVGNSVRMAPDQNIPRESTIGVLKPMVDSAIEPVNTDRPANPIEANNPIITPRIKAGVALSDVAAPAQKLSSSTDEPNPPVPKNQVPGPVQQESPVENANKGVNPDAATLTRVSTMLGKVAPELTEADGKKSGKEPGSQLADPGATKGGKAANTNTLRSTVRSEFDRIQDFIEGKKAGSKFIGQEIQKPVQPAVDSNPSVGEKSQTGVASSPAAHTQPQATNVTSTTSAADFGLMTDRVEGSKNANTSVSAIPKDVPSLPEMIHRVLNLLEVRMHQNQGVQQMQVKTGSYGTLNIQLTRDAQTRKVTILVETESAKDAVRMSLPAITANLDRKGINLSSIDVRLPWEPPAEKQQTSSQDQNFQKNFGSEKNDSNDGRGARTSRDPGNHANSPNTVIPQPKSTRRDFGYNTMEIVA